jgi:UDP-N-acetylglucosamine 4-epimerase
LQSLPHREAQTGVPMSPYAVGKLAAECYARNFHDCYQLATIGLRYFNIFGPRQAVDGAYAAVIPCFVRDILRGQKVQINGDGKTSRDFCFVDNVVQANLLAATTQADDCFGRVFNVASGEQLSILELYQLISSYVAAERPGLEPGTPQHVDFRPGEIRHSLGDISQIIDSLGYSPAPAPREGLSITLDWYLENGATKATG